jgi:hypothetical protein
VAVRAGAHGEDGCGERRGQERHLAPPPRRAGAGPLLPRAHEVVDASQARGGGSFGGAAFGSGRQLLADGIVEVRFELGDKAPAGRRLPGEPPAQARELRRRHAVPPRIARTLPAKRSHSCARPASAREPAAVSR